MSIVNGVIKAPGVEIHEVARTLGSPYTDYGQCCLSDNINPFALKKPVDWDSTNPNPTAANLWYIGKNEDFNLEIKAENYGTPAKIEYRKIAGPPYAILSFDGYQHIGCALGFTAESTTLSQGQSARIYAIHSDNLITIWDIWKYHKNYKSGKIKVVVSFSEEDPCNYYASLYSTYVLPDGYLTIPSARGQVSALVTTDRGVGTYKCYFTIDTGTASMPQYFNLFVDGYPNCFFSHSVICEMAKQVIYVLYRYDMGFFYDARNQVWRSGVDLSPTSTAVLEFTPGNMPYITGFLLGDVIDGDLPKRGTYVAVWEWNSSNLTYNFDRQAVSYLRQYNKSNNSYPGLWSFTKTTVSKDDNIVMGVPLTALPYLDANGVARFVHFYIGAIYDDSPDTVNRISPIWALRIRQTANSVTPDVWQRNL